MHVEMYHEPKKGKPHFIAYFAKTIKVHTKFTLLGDHFTNMCQGEQEVLALIAPLGELIVTH